MGHEPVGTSCAEAIDTQAGRRTAATDPALVADPVAPCRFGHSASAWASLSLGRFFLPPPRTSTDRNIAGSMWQGRRWPRRRPPSPPFSVRTHHGSAAPAMNRRLRRFLVVSSTCAGHLYDASSRSTCVIVTVYMYLRICLPSLSSFSPHSHLSLSLLVVVVVVAVVLADRHPPLCFSLSGQSERDALGQGQTDHGSKIAIISPFRPQLTSVHVLMYSSSLDVLTGHYPLSHQQGIADRHKGPETV